jgi:hypothetical protein
MEFKKKVTKKESNKELKQLNFKEYSKAKLDQDIEKAEKQLVKLELSIKNHNLELEQKQGKREKLLITIQQFKQLSNTNIF